jgi:hypothetical protein
MSEFKDSVVYPLGTALSDRIGRVANDDGWFDEVVRSSTGSDGVRLFVWELSDMGRKVVDDLNQGLDAVPMNILGEVELVLRDPDLDPADLAPYLIEAMDAELLDLKRTDTSRFPAVQAKIRELMGPKSRHLWELMQSSR